MALISCPECNKEISDKAISCPNCGFPLPQVASFEESESTNQPEEITNESVLHQILVRNGSNKIEACKEVSQTLGLSLSESKRLVDEFHKNNPSTNKNTIFKITKTVNGFYIDDNNRLFKYGLLGKILSFDEIIDVDIYENGGSVTKTSTASMLGRAAIGSMINPVGTIIGGVTGKKNSVDIINELKVIISTKNINNPTITIDLKIPKKTKKDSKDYAKSIKKAQEIEATIKAFTYR